MTKIFVGGIPYSATNTQLEELFAKYGQVTSATIIVDRYSGQSKGFAFIEMTNSDEAKKAIEELEGYSLEGRKLGVSEARPKEDHQNSSNSFSRNGDNNSRDDYPPKNSGNSFLKGSHRR